MIQTRLGSSRLTNRSVDRNRLTELTGTETGEKINELAVTGYGNR